MIRPGIPLHSEFSGFTFTGDSYRLNQAIKAGARAHMDEKMPYKEIMTYEGEAYLLYILGDRGSFWGMRLTCPNILC